MYAKTPKGIRIITNFLFTLHETRKLSFISIYFIKSKKHKTKVHNLWKFKRKKL